MRWIQPLKNLDRKQPQTMWTLIFLELEVSTKVTRAEVAEHLSNKKNNKMHPVFSDFKL